MKTKTQAEADLKCLVDGVEERIRLVLMESLRRRLVVVIRLEF